MKPAGIHQLSVSAARGDAIGNEVIQIRDALRAAGHASDIFVELIDPRMASEVRPYGEYPVDEADGNVVLLHYSIGSRVSALAREITDPLVLVYHNITPARWFAPYSFSIARDCAAGRLELAEMRQRCSLGLGDSEYNRRELEELGYAPTGVLPLLLDLTTLDGPGDPLVVERYDDDRPTWLFVGRVVPNKCFEDLVRAFAYYQRYVDHRSRLVIVGEHRTFAPYYDALQALAARFGADNVEFVGHVSGAELNAFYGVADVFVCMSEHEGFCVPVFEAMHRGLPVVAFDAAALPYSTGEGALLLQDKDPAFVAETVAVILGDATLRSRLLARQRRALEMVSRERVIESLFAHLRGIGIDA